MNLQKNELISKLEKISILFKEALSIRIRIEEFTPEDNYERKVNVPVFPGNYKNSNEREYWENLVDHSDIDAIEEMADRYDGVYSPDEPKKPYIKKYEEPSKSDLSDKKIKYSFFSVPAGVIGVLFTLGQLSLIGDHIKFQRFPFFGLFVIVTCAIIVISCRLLKNKAQKVYDKQCEEALDNYEKKKAEILEKYNQEVTVYEEKMKAFKLGRQTFLDEYSKWRDIYLESLEEEADIEEKLDADRLAEVEKIREEELNPALLTLNNFNDIIAADYLPVLDTIIDLIRSGRADDLKEAINLYEEIEYRERQLELQREIEEQRQYEEELRREDEERRYREEMEFREEQENQRRREEEKRQADAERRHKEEMNLRRQQELDRQIEERKRQEEEKRQAGKAELERKMKEDAATRRQCNTCALNGRCTVAFTRPNCASYRPR